MDALVIKDLNFKWNTASAPLLSIDNLRINLGTRVFLHGASGSGKSTLLSLISGILLPQSGSIHLLGHSITELNGAERDTFRADHIGYIFQMFNLLPYLSVIENVTLPCYFSKKRYTNTGGSEQDLKQEAMRLLEKLGLSGKDLLNKPVTELSLGQQQRVAACRALIGGPEILIADEPTSALDADAQMDFLALLAEECTNKKITLIFVSHDQRLSREFDKVIHLNNGTLSLNSHK